MKKPNVLALLGLVCAGTAFAAPRESVTFTNVESWGRYQQTDGAVNANPTLTHTFTGNDGGGAYNATHLTVSGQLTRISVNTYFCESTIYVQPPGGGTPFLIQPFNTPQTAVPGGAIVAVGAIPAGAYTIPVGSITTAGEWSFLFYERFNDITGRDAVWDTITITLNDGPPPTPAPIGSFGHTFTNVTVNQADGAGFDQSFTLPAGMVAGGVRIRAQGTALMTPNANTRITPTNQLRVRVTPPSGVPLEAATVFPLYSPSSDISEVLVSLPGNLASTGSWRVEAFMNVFGHEAFLRTLAVELVPPATPTAVNLGTLAANATLTGNATVTAPGQTKWFKFTLNDAVDGIANRGLEVDTEGSTTVDGAATLNTSLALYSAVGARLGFDYADGTASLGSLSFGVDNHPAPGDGQPYNGRDGAGISPGDCYVAVAAGDTGVTFATGVFGVTNPSTQLGAVRVNVRLTDPGATTPASIDAGTITGNPDGSERTTTVNVPLDRESQVRWVKFTLASDASNDAVKYVDIDTEPALPDGDPDAGTINDQEIGLYRADGTFIVTDDDDGSGYHSQLSFGDLNNWRNAYGNGEQGNGRDGDLPADTYYLAACLYNAAFGTTYWNVTTNTTTATGTFQVNFRSNLAAPAVCGLADVGSTGGAPGADAHLDNNDFVVYIDYFFTHNVIADMGTTGGVPGADSVWDNNDFVVYIDYFFTAPASCR